MNSLSTVFTGEKRKRGRRNKDSTETGEHTSNDKDNVIRNPIDVMKNNIVYIRNENARKRMLKPSGSNFNLLKTLP